jgi:hypothetical protein
MTVNGKWNVPNWLDAAAYAVDRSPPEWAWQFLRRNPEYRECWQRHVEPNVVDNIVTRFDQQALAERFGLWMPVAPWVAEHLAPPFVAQITPMTDMAVSPCYTYLILGDRPRTDVRPRADRYPLYLRILDATDAGVREVEVRRVLGMQDKKGWREFEYAWNRAHHLRNSGYREIASAA